MISKLHHCVLILPVLTAAASVVLRFHCFKHLCCALLLVGSVGKTPGHHRLTPRAVTHTQEVIVMIAHCHGHVFLKPKVPKSKSKP